MRSAELYINLANIFSNWNALNRLSNGSAGAVVKANAYGLGIKEVGISLAKAGDAHYHEYEDEMGGGCQAHDEVHDEVHDEPMLLSLIHI